MFINIQMFLAFSHVLLMQYISPSTSLGGGGVENIARYLRRIALCTYRYRCLRLGSYFSTSPTFRLRYGSMPVNFGPRQEASRSCISACRCLCSDPPSIPYRHLCLALRSLTACVDRSNMYRARDHTFVRSEHVNTRRIQGLSDGPALGFVGVL